VYSGLVPISPYTIPSAAMVRAAVLLFVDWNWDDNWIPWSN